MVEPVRGRAIDGREMSAYAIAHALRIASALALGFSGALAPLYSAVFRSGGYGLFLTVSLSVSAILMLLALGAFLIARGLIGGTPVAISGDRGEHAMTSRGGEIGAWLIAHAAGIAVLYLVNALFLNQIYISLRQSGQGVLGTTIGVSLSAVVTAGMFLLFVALRGAFPRDAVPPVTTVTERPVGRADLAGIGGWLIPPAIGCVIGPIIGGVSLFYGLTLYENVARAGFGGVYALELLVNAGVVAFLIYVAVVFFSRKRSAPAAFIALMVAQLVSRILLLAIEGGSGADVFVAESIKQLIFDAIGAAIWIPYFMNSERVRMTFVN